MPHVVVLGANGLIGSACVLALKARGMQVTGVGRGPAGRAPVDRWITMDIGQADSAAWHRALQGAEVVVNAAGALQDGPRDDLTAVHDTAVRGLCAAAKGRGLRVVQISAAGVSPDAPTAFFRTKAAGDAILAASDLDWIILRPVLVFGAPAFGGTALLRAAASLPGVVPQIFADAPVQAIALDELAEAVADCAEAKMPLRRIYDLAEAERRAFPDCLALVRDWLGLAPARARVPVPGFALAGVGRIADGLGRLGWRSPLRSTALTTLRGGITGDAGLWLRAGGRPFTALPHWLARNPATLQDRWFARFYLLMPLVLSMLALFWMISGVIGLWQLQTAAEVLTARGFGDTWAVAAVLTGAVADITLGAMVLVRRWARVACLGMVALTLGYLGAATLWAPDLWADPLGPLVKTLPAAVLALIALPMLEER